MILLMVLYFTGWNSDVGLTTCQEGGELHFKENIFFLEMQVIRLMVYIFRLCDELI